MADTGAKYPGSGTNDTAVGSIAWSNPGNITTENDTAASALVFEGAESNYLCASGFGFSIPTSATINGIVVEVRNRSADSGMVDSSIRLKKSSYVGDNKAQYAWNDSPFFNYVTYGGASDLWGTTWTPTEVNDSSFGVGISSYGASDTTYGYVDTIRITVYYTLPQDPKFLKQQNGRLLFQQSGRGILL